MGSYLSPGVYAKEIDLTNIVPTVSSSSAAVVFYSEKGDTTQLRLITNSQQFISQYGNPILGDYGKYSALAYLENGNQLYCYRVQNGALYGGVKIKTSISAQVNSAISAGVSSPDFVSISGQDNLINIYSANPGVWGNKVAVQIANIDAVTYEFDIVVYAQDSSGTYQLVETWSKVSRKLQIDGFGNQQYLETVINGFSDYIWVADDATQAETVLPKVQSTNLVFAQGSDGSSVSDSHYITGWGLFSNPDNVDVRLLICAGQTSVAVQTEMKTVAEGRKDCIAILDVPLAQTSSVSATMSWRSSTQNFNSSYCALYSPWIKVYDSFNGQIVTLPPSGYVASMYAYNDFAAEVWYAPAGFTRGALNVLSITPIYSQGDRDSLYTVGVNPLQNFRGSGSVIWGQKTQQTKASATDRVNVRRLLITLEKAITTSLRGFTFEPNSEITRFRITAMIESYLDTLSAKGAFQTELGDKGYAIVCNSTNNTATTIDRGELHVDVYVKPSRSAEFIVLQTIITPTGVTFSELISKGISL